LRGEKQLSVYVWKASLQGNRVNVR